MKRAAMGLLQRPSVQITLCLLAYAVLVAWGGSFVAVVSSPLLAAALSRPIINGLRNLRHGMRHRVWQEAQGTYYAYRDTSIHVLEDMDHCRWVRMADVRAVIGTTASDRALAKTYPSGWQAVGKKTEGYLRDDALVAHLCKENRPQALRMGHWAQRSILFPGQQIRKNLGIRVAPPTSIPDEDEGN